MSCRTRGTSDSPTVRFDPETVDGVELTTWELVATNRD